MRSRGEGGEQRLGPHGDGQPGHLGQRQLAANPRRALQHNDLYRLVPQEERRGQPSDAAADDRDHWPCPGLLHPFTIGRASGGSGGGAPTWAPAKAPLPPPHTPPRPSSPPAAGEPPPAPPPPPPTHPPRPREFHRPTTARPAR